MRIRNLFLLLGVACIFGPGSGTARIKSSADAPWKPGKVAAYWVQTTETEERDDEGGDDTGWYYDYDYSRAYGQGMLFLVDSDEVNCDMLLAQDWQEEDAARLGDGLIILFQYYDYAYGDDELEKDLGFEGLYLGGESYAIDSGADRQMLMYALYDGYMSPLTFYYFALDPSWARIDAVSEDGVEGEFYNETWEGKFNATNCGTLPEPYWEDSGYDY